MMSYSGSHTSSNERKDSSLSGSEGVQSLEGASGGSGYGSLTRDQRNERVLKYWEKKKRRKSQRYIRYECRKNLAEKRFRF